MKSRFVLTLVCVILCSVVTNAQGWLEKQRERHKLEGNDIESVELSFDDRRSELTMGGKIRMIAEAYPAQGRKMKSEGVGNGKTAWNNYKVEVEGGSFDEEEGDVLVSSNPNDITNHRIRVKVTVLAYPNVTEEIEIPLKYDEDIVIHGEGAPGKKGGSGQEGKKGSWGATGYRGGNGGNGGNGGSAHSFELWATSLSDDALEMEVLKILVKDLNSGWSRVFYIDPNEADFKLLANGGDGGCGGNGGKGGYGGPARSDQHYGGDGGQGGHGGNGGDGGSGGNIVLHLDPSASAYKKAFELENEGGRGGCGGEGGFGGIPGGFEGGKGSYGSRGSSGSSGSSGRDGARNEIIVEKVNIEWKTSGGSSTHLTSTQNTTQSSSTNSSSTNSSGSASKPSKGKRTIAQKYSNGQVSYTGKVSKDEKKQGQWMYYYEDGKTKKEENYNEKGELHGPYKEYGNYEDGYISEEGTYTNGVKSGEWKEYRIDGTVEEMTVYNLDKNTTIITDFYENGEKKRVEHLKDEKRHGLLEKYRSDGKLSKTEMYKDGKLHGLSVSYSSSGDKSSETTYDNGIKSGPFKDYRRGKLYEEGNYLNRRKTGLWIRYHSNGEIKSKATFDENGDLVGDYFAFHDNGAKEVEGQYVDGHREGEWKEFDEEGNLEEVEHYIEGDKEGVYLRYRKNVLKEEGNYSKDKKTGHWKFYNNAGKLWEEGDYVEGKKSGEWITYDTDTGEVEERKQY